MIEVKNVTKPDERRDFPHGHLELVTLTGMTFGRATFEPGWRWSQDVKPIAGTEYCMFQHMGFVEQGHMRVRMQDGEEADFSPGDAVMIPPGHDAWVIGDEPCVMFDLAEEDRGYAKAQS